MYIYEQIDRKVFIIYRIFRDIKFVCEDAEPETASNCTNVRYCTGVYGFGSSKRPNQGEKSMAEKMDRRIRKTKALLSQGLIQLMEEKEIRDISVKELTDLADINRGTFYLHYNDIYDLLTQMEDELFVEFNEILDRTMKDGEGGHSPRAVLLEVFCFLERHWDLARVMVGPHGDFSFVNRMKSLIGKRIYNILASKHRDRDCLYIEAFAISGCVGVVETWLSQSAPAAPEEMAAICSRLLLEGLGLE